MRLTRKLTTILAVVAAALVLSAGTSRADARVGWAFLFPIPVPIPIYEVPHDPSPVAVGLLFPIPVPLPVYDYGYHGGHHRAYKDSQEEQYGRLQTMVTPKTASVYVDGKYVGKAGEFMAAKDSITLDPGRRVVEFGANGYKSYKAEVEVKPGGLVKIEAELAPLH